MPKKGNETRFRFQNFISMRSCWWWWHYFLQFYCYCSDWLLRSALHAKIWPQVTTMLQWGTENDQQMNKQASTMLQILTGKRAANKQLLTSMLQLRAGDLFRERCFTSRCRPMSTLRFIRVLVTVCQSAHIGFTYTLESLVLVDPSLLCILFFFQAALPSYSSPAAHLLLLNHLIQYF